jgi:hypothetical protein
MWAITKATNTIPVTAMTTFFPIAVYHNIAMARFVAKAESEAHMEQRAPRSVASKIAHYAMDNDLTLKTAALTLGFVTEELFDRVVDPKKMVEPYVAEK